MAQNPLAPGGQNPQLQALNNQMNQLLMAGPAPQAAQGAPIQQIAGAQIGQAVTARGVAYRAQNGYMSLFEVVRSQQANGAVAQPNAAYGNAIAAINLRDAGTDAKIRGQAAFTKFQSFDVAQIRAALVAKFEANCTVVGDAERANAFADELLAILIAYISRGVSVNSLISRGDVEQRNFFVNMCTKYGITNKAGGSSSAITLLRVAQAYPELVTSVIGSGLIPEWDPKGTADLVPRWLMQSCIAQLIPMGSLFWIVFLAWLKTHDDVITGYKNQALLRSGNLAMLVQLQQVQNQMQAANAGKAFWYYAGLAANSTTFAVNSRKTFLTEALRIAQDGTHQRSRDTARISTANADPGATLVQRVEAWCTEARLTAARNILQQVQGIDYAQFGITLNQAVAQV